ncbi:MAG: hypothetical protein AMJ94_16695 [Deltaproteobacteria bacterium SM23_61]|nr:MAG: hypothetical protein AMJ94_16695 [Deltaproteobacteria bacterium SM23_61]
MVIGRPRCKVGGLWMACQKIGASQLGGRPPGGIPGPSSGNTVMIFRYETRGDKKDWGLTGKNGNFCEFMAQKR